MSQPGTPVSAPPASVYQLLKPRVALSLYWPEALLLVVSFLTPIVAWIVFHDEAILERSGSLMLFLGALAEFVTLNRMNKKHLLNACRAKAHETPWDFSPAAKIVGVVSLVAALLGTVLWGFGTLIF
jgi:uncharacterized membrane protein